MQKISIEQKFDCTLDVLLRARMERYNHLERFPELKNVKVLEEEKSETSLKQKRSIHIAESLPPVLATLLPPGSDTLVEDSFFDLKNNIHTFTVTPGGNLDKIFTIKGVSTYKELDTEHSVRIYELEIISRAFIVGPVVETTIAEIYRKNLEKDKKSIGDFILMLNEKKSDERN